MGKGGFFKIRTKLGIMPSFLRTCRTQKPLHCLLRYKPANPQIRDTFPGEPPAVAIHTRHSRRKKSQCRAGSHSAAQASSPALLCKASASWTLGTLETHCSPSLAPCCPLLQHSCATFALQACPGGTVSCVAPSSRAK